jgi:ABC-type lipoprotein release transport system permease subunit
LTHELRHALRLLWRAPGFAALAMISGLVPAMRAARTDPAIALRSQ